MGLEEILQIIKPGLTLYGVLVTLSVLFFLAGRFFWRFEDQLRKDYIERLRDLMQGFRASHIEPFFGEQLVKAREEAYSLLATDLLADFYEKKEMANGTFQRELKGSDEISKLVSEAALENRVDRLKKADEEGIVRFLDSGSGEEIFSKLDLQYARKSEFWLHYLKACSACKRIAYASFGLSVLMMLGLLKSVASWPEATYLFWIFIAGQTLVYAIYSFVRLEIGRNRMTVLWEKFQIYGEI